MTETGVDYTVEGQDEAVRRTAPGEVARLRRWAAAWKAAAKKERVVRLYREDQFRAEIKRLDENLQWAAGRRGED
jgi:hypothetical protein